MNLKISKILIIILLIYSFWFKEAYFDLPWILYGTVALSWLFILMDILQRGGKIYTGKIDKIVKMYFIFGMFALITGVFLANDKSIFFNQIFQYWSFVIVCLAIDYISRNLKNVRWILDTVIVVAAMCALQCLIAGYDYYNGIIVTTMGPNNNPNSLGLVMAIGMIGLMISSRNSIVVRNIIATLFLYIVIISGSRKAFFVSVVIYSIILYNTIFKAKDDNKNKVILASLKKIFIISFILVLVFVLGDKLLQSFHDTSIFERLLNFESELKKPDSLRIALYKDAFQMWKQSPILGIGFCQYMVYSPYKFYSHSSYAEIFACTGIIGTFIFYVPVLYMIKKTFKKMSISTNREEKYKFKLLILIIVVELFFWVGQIVIYDLLHMLVLMYISKVANNEVE